MTRVRPVLSTLGSLEIGSAALSAAHFYVGLPDEDVLADIDVKLLSLRGTVDEVVVLGHVIPLDLRQTRADINIRPLIDSDNSSQEELWSIS